ncbi:glycosyltransferase family 2 protein [Zunongwangia atlantica]|uniref:Glycosyl transferase family protein n=1 Tax=Zunongwangia atlantica 22II14-10F7 TaxID=1185767 RepID=A0A1Y1T9Q9_9FLAO|nr:glycosyltransferase [Zunongwangia atlantica]ORL47422.1 glycosyl transferase family protein [Zunongwangia atlantica 22II14-10F7]
MNNRLSIVIPCYNDGKYIEQAIDSALNQSYLNKEIIVVDDGSDMRTKKILSQIKAKVDKLIVQDNQGVGAARNTGIRSAKGDYILILDADDYFEPNFAKEAIDIVNVYDEVKLVSSWSRWFLDKDNYRIFRPQGGNLQDYLFQNRAMGSVLFRKDCWELAGGYDEKMTGYEDWEFYIRLHQNGGYTYIIEKVLFHYRNKAKSRNKKATINKNELLKYIFSKNHKLYKDNFNDLLDWFFSYNDQTSKSIEKSKKSSIIKKIVSKFKYFAQLIII